MTQDEQTLLMFKGIVAELQNKAELRLNIVLLK